MLELYIVDDESSVRTGLTECIDWSRYGVEIVGSAANGEIASREIQNLCPDLVITDIKMPFMDGIELAKRLHGDMPETEIIFLSGYDDVEFLKEAIKVEAVDYIFKPLDLVELDKVLQKAIDRINRRKSNIRQLSDMQEKIDQSFPLLRENFMANLLKEGNGDGNLEQRLKFLSVPLPVDERYCVFLISIDNKGIVFENKTEKERQVCSILIKEAILAVVPEQTRGFALGIDTGVVALILSLSGRDEEILDTVANELRRTIGKNLAYDFTIGIGCVADGLAHIRESYLTAQEAVLCKLYYGRNKIIAFDALTEGYQEDVKNSAVFNEEKFCNILYTGVEDRLSVYIEKIFSTMRRDKFSRQKVRIVSMQIALSALKQLIRDDAAPPGDIPSETALVDKLNKLETAEDMKNYVRDFTVRICERNNQKRASEPSKVVARIMEIIGRRYGENLTITDISKEIYLTATYLCLVFKHQTGMTINDYLTKVRMNKAIDLLKSSPEKLGQICEMVGYNDPSYFCKLFKKYTGLTPSQYREREGTL